MLQRYLKLILVGLILTVVARADDAIEDVEAEMDTAFAESDAARSEADAARARKAEEKSRLEKAKQDARAEVEKARSTESQAKKKIADLERESSALRKQREGFEAQIRTAQKQIQMNEQSIAKAQQRRDKLALEKQTTLEEKAKQTEDLRLKKEELVKIDAEIKSEREALNQAAIELKDLKAKNAATDVEVKKRYHESEKEKARIHAKKAEYTKLLDAEKMRAGLRFKIISLKQDCNLHQEADLTSKVLNRVKKSTKVTLAKFNADGWFRVDGATPGFMHKTCE